MSTEQNKAIVRRFVNEVLATGKPDLIDELLAPNYVNRALDVDREGFRQSFSLINQIIPDGKFTIEDLVAEGDHVILRGTLSGTNTGSFMGSKPTGKRISMRVLTYYRLANGKIVEDDPFTSPNMFDVLGIKLPEKMETR
jgi:predicted ester cyclase